MRAFKLIRGTGDGYPEQFYLSKPRAITEGAAWVMHLSGGKGVTTQAAHDHTLIRSHNGNVMARIVPVWVDETDENPKLKTTPGYYPPDRLEHWEVV